MGKAKTKSIYLYLALVANLLINRRCSSQISDHEKIGPTYSEVYHYQVVFCHRVFHKVYNKKKRYVAYKLHLVQLSRLYSINCGFYRN